MKQYDIYSRGAWDKFFTKDLAEHIDAQNNYFDQQRKHKKHEVPMIPCESKEIYDKMVFYYTDILGYIFNKKSNTFDLNHLNWPTINSVITNWNFV